MLAVHPDTQAAIASFVATPSHAVALVGTAGLGKTLLAKNIASQVLGIAEATLPLYPYFRTIAPQDGTITITQVRDIHSFFTLTIPSKSKHAIARVVLVEDADTMTREAQNAFLKMLEEPPEDALCILTLGKTQKLLATVRSRLQLIHVHKPHLDDIVRSFGEDLRTDKNAIEKALVLSDGNIAAARRLVASPAEATADSPVDLVKATLAGDTFTRLTMVDRLLDSKPAALQYVDTLLLVASASLHKAAQCDSARLKLWQQIMQAAQTAQAALAKNGNAKLVFTELMLSL